MQQRGAYLQQRGLFAEERRLFAAERRRAPLQACVGCVLMRAVMLCVCKAMSWCAPQCLSPERSRAACSGLGGCSRGHARSARMSPVLLPGPRLFAGLGENLAGGREGARAVEPCA